MHKWDTGRIGENLTSKILPRDYLLTKSKDRSADIIAQNNEEKLLINVKTGNISFSASKKNLDNLIKMAIKEGGIPSLLFVSFNESYLYSLQNIYHHNNDVKNEVSRIGTPKTLTAFSLSTEVLIALDDSIKNHRYKFRSDALEAISRECLGLPKEPLEKGEKN